jgi:hypothetical protein
MCVDFPEPTEIFPESPDGAEGLRNQAAACRRLAAQARTKAGTTSMTALADHFDEQAQRVDLAQSAGGADKSDAEGIAK